LKILLSLNKKIMKGITYILYVPKGFEKHGEVAQKLMETFEIGGVFSDILIKKVYDILYMTSCNLEEGKKEEVYTYGRYPIIINV
jgi:hypothetical protein